MCCPKEPLNPVKTMTDNTLSKNKCVSAGWLPIPRKQEDAAWCQMSLGFERKGV